MTRFWPPVFPFVAWTRLVHFRKVQHCFARQSRIASESVILGSRALVIIQGTVSFSPLPVLSPVFQSLSCLLSLYLSIYACVYPIISFRCIPITLFHRSDYRPQCSSLPNYCPEGTAALASCGGSHLSPQASSKSFKKAGRYLGLQIIL